ncbi:hypothetical protein GCM10015535_24950 [Streptomyces gelaticus]|uniref:DUF7848 domain-containing protein n=1 Tax=Streptomyces gelaticus TaxID=285446 RepID=A0ABQ2VX73_9ACTN|nr:hypothetical protein GCM10015535_24950 [Streptomyces gelaticus]
MGADVLSAARKVLADPLSPHAEVRYATLRLSECLTDALRIAESRGLRLSAPDAEEDDSDSEHPPRLPHDPRDSAVRPAHDPPPGRGRVDLRSVLRCAGLLGGFRPAGHQETAQEWALAHTGRNPTHDLFRRVVTDHAPVTRDE